MIKKFSTLLLFSILLIGLSGCGRIKSGNTIPLVDGPHFNVADGRIVVSMVIKKVDLGQGLALPIPELPNSEVSVSPNLEGGMLVQFFLNPQDFKNPLFDFVDPQYLPGGRPFPFIMGGELPSIAIQSEKLFNSSFYLSRKVFAIFLPFKHPVNFDIAQRIRIKGKNVGMIALMKKDTNNLNSGLLLLLTPKSIEENAALNKLIEVSKRNPSRVY